MDGSHRWTGVRDRVRNATKERFETGDLIDPTDHEIRVFGENLAEIASGGKNEGEQGRGRRPDDVGKPDGDGDRGDRGDRGDKEREERVPDRDGDDEEDGDSEEDEST